MSCLLPLWQLQHFRQWCTVGSIPTGHLCDLRDDEQRRHSFRTLLSTVRLTAPAGFFIEEE